MADWRARLGALDSLERLAAGNTCIHALHPYAKLAATLVYLVCLLSLGRYEFARLAPYLLYPMLMLALAEAPYRLVFGRALLALPFCLFAGLSNLVLERAPLVSFGALTLSAGAVSCAVLLLRTYLCVAAVLALVAVTPLPALTGALRRLHVPGFFVSLLELCYRYLGTLGEEASSLSAAYRLRAGGARGVALSHFGSLAGGLLLRSLDRAERVYAAMQCRGYPRRMPDAPAQPLRRADLCFAALACGSSILFRAADIPALLGRWF